ncbi:MAG: InlB B-repeat-containing protein, partial [Firmicutes bacterium]|nr:InlB B-repeat-containing protein [Bacillota bacterium]
MLYRTHRGIFSARFVTTILAFLLFLSLIFAFGLNANEINLSASQNEEPQYVASFDSTASVLNPQASIVQLGNYQRVTYTVNSSSGGFNLNSLYATFDLDGEVVKLEQIGSNWVLPYVYSDYTLSATFHGALTSTITWNLNTGDANLRATLRDGIGARPTTYVHGIGVRPQNMPSVTRDGFTFRGWRLGNANGAWVVEILPSQTGNITLFAFWNRPSDILGIAVNADSDFIFDHLGNRAMSGWKPTTSNEVGGYRYAHQGVGGDWTNYSNGITNSLTRGSWTWVERGDNNVRFDLERAGKESTFHGANDRLGLSMANVRSSELTCHPEAIVRIPITGNVRHLWLNMGYTMQFRVRVGIEVGAGNNNTAVTTESRARVSLNPGRGTRFQAGNASGYFGASMGDFHSSGPNSINILNPQEAFPPNNQKPAQFRRSTTLETVWVSPSGAGIDRSYLTLGLQASFRLSGNSNGDHWVRITSVELQSRISQNPTLINTFLHSSSNGTSYNQEQVYNRPNSIGDEAQWPRNATSYTLPSPNSIPSGYRFLGWGASANFNATSANVSHTVGQAVNAGTTLYAQYAPNTHVLGSANRFLNGEDPPTTEYLAPKFKPLTPLAVGDFAEPEKDKFEGYVFHSGFIENNIWVFLWREFVYCECLRNCGGLTCDLACDDCECTVDCLICEFDGDSRCGDICPHPNCSKVFGCQKAPWCYCCTTCHLYPCACPFEHPSSGGGEFRLIAPNTHLTSWGQEIVVEVWIYNNNNNEFGINGAGIPISFDTAVLTHKSTVINESMGGTIPSNHFSNDPANGMLFISVLKDISSPNPVTAPVFKFATITFSTSSTLIYDPITQIAVDTRNEDSIIDLFSVPLLQFHTHHSSGAGDFVAPISITIISDFCYECVFSLNPECGEICLHPACDIVYECGEHICTDCDRDCDLHICGICERECTLHLCAICERVCDSGLYCNICNPKCELRECLCACLRTDCAVPCTEHTCIDCGRTCDLHVCADCARECDFHTCELCEKECSLTCFCCPVCYLHPCKCPFENPSSGGGEFRIITPSLHNLSHGQEIVVEVWVYNSSEFNISAIQVPILFDTTVFTYVKTNVFNNSPTEAGMASAQTPRNGCVLIFHSGVPFSANNHISAPVFKFAEITLLVNNGVRIGTQTTVSVSELDTDNAFIAVTEVTTVIIEYTHYDSNIRFTEDWDIIPGDTTVPATITITADPCLECKFGETPNCLAVCLSIGCEKLFICEQHICEDCDIICELHVCIPCGEVCTEHICDNEACERICELHICAECEVGCDLHTCAICEVTCTLHICGICETICELHICNDTACNRTCTLHTCAICERTCGLHVCGDCTRTCGLHICAICDRDCTEHTCDNEACNRTCELHVCVTCDRDCTKHTCDIAP